METRVILSEAMQANGKCIIGPVDVNDPDCDGRGTPAIPWLEKRVAEFLKSKRVLRVEVEEVGNERNIWVLAK